MANLANPELCPVRNAFLLILRKTRLNHLLDLPLAIFVNKSGDVKYLTASKIEEVIHKVTRTAYPDLSEEEIQKFLATQLESGHVYFSVKWAKILI